MISRPGQFDQVRGTRRGRDERDDPITERLSGRAHLITGGFPPGGPVRPGAALYSLEGDFGFSPPNATDPAPEIGHEVKLINLNQVPGSPLALRIENFARNSTGDQAFVTPNINGFNRPTNVRVGPDGCAYVADYGAVRDQGADSHVVGTGNGSLVQIPGTGVVWKICPM